MSNENTSLKNVTPVGDSNANYEMSVGKSITYQRTFLILAGSLLALFVLVVVGGESGGQHFKSSRWEIAKSVGAIADIFDIDAVSENESKI